MTSSRSDVTRQLFLPGPAGRLEALLAMPRGMPRGIAVVCHPHSLYGGALTNKVVYTLAGCALKTGLAALRFNFRGVGDSQGRFDNAIGETDDTLACVDWLARRLPGLPLLLAGFSFGAHVALKAAGRVTPRALVTISIAFGRYVAAAKNPPHPHCPWLAVHSRDDDVVAYADSRVQLQRYAPPPQLLTLDGAGHFYHRHLGQLQAAVLPFLRTQWTD
ncbi:MAG: hypothetical protein KGJ55_06110 [Gammaproteobacteria bacterium]|nr:hypothetical protein [Gammaproteobacteria bacterium]